MDDDQRSQLHIESGDRPAGALADQQFGVISRAQAFIAGLTPRLLAATEDLFRRDLATPDRLRAR
ncbi:MAG TPA: hypothetical protein VGA62_06530, partial [Acidimicrobiia bacterium]